MLRSWRAPGSRYLRNLGSHNNGAFLSIFLKLLNYVCSECIFIIYKFVCNWNSSFGFINKFHKLFAQASYIRAWMSLKFGQIRPWTTELAALERLKN